MATMWIRGRFEGPYRGDQIAVHPGERVYDLRIDEGTITDARRIDGPPHIPDDGPEPIRLQMLPHARFPGGTEELRECPLYDVTIVAWKRRHDIETDRETHGTLVGTIYARLDRPVSEQPAAPPVTTSPVPRPPPVSVKPPVQPRLPMRDPPAGLVENDTPLRGFAAELLLFLLAFGVLLFFLCGPITAVVWAVVTLFALGCVATRKSLARVWWRPVLSLALVVGSTGMAVVLATRLAELACSVNGLLELVALAAIVVIAALRTGPRTIAWTLFFWSIGMAMFCMGTGGHCLEGAVQDGIQQARDTMHPAGKAPAKSSSRSVIDDIQLPGAIKDGIKRVSVDEAMRTHMSPCNAKDTHIFLAGDTLFEFDDDGLHGTSELSRLAMLLRDNAGCRVVLEGHADTIGDSNYNQNLSVRRAQAVRTWLIDHEHVNPAQASVVGYGSSHPIVSPLGTRDEQRANRRVEVRAQ